MIYVVIALLLSVLLTNLILYRLHTSLGALTHLIASHVSREDNIAVQVQKSKKPSLPLRKQAQRGRNVVNTDDLVDIADLPWQDALKIIEDMGDGQLN